MQIASSSLSITFGWSAPVYNGGTSITDYQIYWNGGIDYNPFVQLSSTTFGFIIYTYQTSLTPGNYYEFKVTTINAIGESAYSVKIRIIAASVPDAPVNLVLVS